MEPLIIVIEGRDKDILKDPQVLKTMERFQRYLERDPDVGYSFSLSDVVQAINMTFYDMQPRWGVIPAEIPKISSLFFYYFAGAPPGETSRFLDGSYRVSHVTFYCKNHQGDNVARIIKHARDFTGAEENQMTKADFRLAGGLIGVTGAANEEILKNDILMNILGFGTIFIIITFTYRSAVAALVMMVAMFLANGIVNAYMGYRNIGINLQSLPIVTVGLGFGIDYGVYLVSRAVEEFPKVMDQTERAQRKNATEEALTTEADLRGGSPRLGHRRQGGHVYRHHARRSHPLVGVFEYSFFARKWACCWRCRSVSAS